jgi:hypothetical protein
MMRRITRILLPGWIAVTFLLVAHTAWAQKEWREYPGMETGWYRDAEISHGYQGPAEFVVGRLMYPQARHGRVLGAGGGDWLRGGTAWTVDYPEGDRTFARLLERLSMIDVRLVEQPVNLGDEIDVYYWPFLISGLVGAWDLTDAQALKLREYLLRGGFLLCDSVYGSAEWQGFLQGMIRVFPDRPIVDLPDTHPIFHSVYDLADVPQIPTWQHLPRGYRNNGAKPRCRGQP